MPFCRVVGQAHEERIETSVESEEGRAVYVKEIEMAQQLRVAATREFEWWN